MRKLMIFLFFDGFDIYWDGVGCYYLCDLNFKFVRVNGV